MAFAGGGLPGTPIVQFMRLQIFSDLHLEFGAPPDLPPAEADVVVLAEDGSYPN